MNMHAQLKPVDDGFSYQGLTVVVSFLPLTSYQVMKVVPYINDHHDGRLSHGELMTKIQRFIGAESDWDSKPVQ